jgi:hypothetical protein
VQNHRGQPLVDAEGQVLEAGSIVIDSMLGEGMDAESSDKAYKQVRSSLQKSMDEMRAMKAIYVYSNHNLCEHIQSACDNRQAMRSAPSVPLARSSGQRKRSS